KEDNMSEKKSKAQKPAVLFGATNVTKVGYIDEYIFACEIKGEDHIVYSKPRKPKYHLVIIVLEGNIEIIINGEKFRFGKNTYINLPTWSDIYEIRYDKDFHAMATATDRSVVEDIFRNRNPFPLDFRFRIDHGIGGEIIEKEDINVPKRDISNMIMSLSNKDHLFAEEINYAYFYILLTDMADMMWKRYGKGKPSHHTEMSRADGIMKEFAELLVNHIYKETSVEFYAERLCISKQYLSLIVKEKTRVTIGTIISAMRAEAAARLLRDPEKTIQQIAEELSFADQSSFGKFFKKHAGLSPLKYRQTLRKTLLTLRQ
ncbi:MAG: AraC family transcriptional regulator, partial [Paludibacteraceae bacterium]|nr:AraC family transcriptional regulator [Paludibacteraceae bacterium]